ncbi:MAG: 1,4-alpha-glucan branching protein GlgB [Chlamydiia bacterium]|nr:1,4-alpha-glucan branching protein GlgB [Chlamydiia bacterium]
MAHDPHAHFGLHEESGRQFIRLWRPDANTVHLEVLGRIVEAVPERNSPNHFLFFPSQKIGAQDYRIYHSSSLLAHDPYAFLPTIGELDLFLFNKGCHYELYNILGAHSGVFHGVRGVRFAVWAPNAEAVSLVADFNAWNGQMNPMRSMGASGIWELFVPALQEGEKYKFEIKTREGYLRIKSDPMAFYSELRPATASIVSNVNQMSWTDSAWLSSRIHQTLNRPIQIYEVHLGSWRREGEAFPRYRQLALALAEYCKEMHFTHVELLPIMEHPLDESWGYQVTGFYAVTSRYGTVADFQFFVDYLHTHGIGVILDWVPAHFPLDDYALSRFDGTCLYEHEDPRKGIHPHWQTAIFNYGRAEVSNFLIASALFWFEKMHIDGLRVDAVASLLYLDYGRKEGEWIPNLDGSRYNLEAIEFLKHLNTVVHSRFPGVLMIAEESSSYQGITHPVDQNGLGFDLKWNMGWMNDTLRYFATDPLYRKFCQNDLTFSLLYAFSEKFMAVLSHDEVVHGKGSLLAKMPGPDWQKFATLRLLYSYMICHPGKKILFMGGEIGQWNEWDCQRSLDWEVLQYPLHQGMRLLVRDLNQFLQERPPLWKNDFDWQGYEWIDFSDAERSVIAYLRKGGGDFLACVHHCTPEVHPQYRLGLKNVKKMVEVFTTDALEYGGSNVTNAQIQIESDSIFITLGPLTTAIFEVQFHDA